MLFALAIISNNIYAQSGRESNEWLGGAIVLLILYGIYRILRGFWRFITGGNSNTKDERRREDDEEDRRRRERKKKEREREINRQKRDFEDRLWGDWHRSHYQ